MVMWNALMFFFFLILWKQDPLKVKTIENVFWRVSPGYRSMKRTGAGPKNEPTNSEIIEKVNKSQVSAQ